jgi:hypothetical protein
MPLSVNSPDLLDGYGLINRQQNARVDEDLTGLGFVTKPRQIHGQAIWPAKSEMADLFA